MVTCLVEAGANLHDKTKAGQTELHYDAGSSVEEVRILVENGVAVSHADKGGAHSLWERGLVVLRQEFYLLDHDTRGFAKAKQRFQMRGGSSTKPSTIPAAELQQRRCNSRSVAKFS
jgi:hypothetical protein